ncbi:MAG: adenylate/guanylate cyclase domain-containing protein [Phaeospirillum sp.]|nr:adenylate/guanylate cyclase domain-containing protein [Phaeospirillum sp.]
MAFILLVVPLIGALVGYVYRTNADLALNQATSDMDRVTRDIVDEVQNLLSPAARVVEGIAVQARMDQGALRRNDGLRYFFDQVENLPQLESLYIGFDRDGGFYQVLHTAGVTSFGPSARPVPVNARYALRILDASSSKRADSYIYLADWGDIVGVERNPATYDPRVRPWYKEAWTSAGTVISDVYPFASSGKAGVTVSRRVESDDGVAIGAVGANITLARLSAFLAQRKIGQQGRVFILDAEGHLIAHPQPDMGVRKKGKTLELLQGRDVADTIVADAVRRREAGAGDVFSAELGDDGMVYRINFAPFPEQFRKRWMIGVIVQEDEFIGPLRRLSLRFLAVGGVVIFFSVAAILWLSHLLTRPLSLIIRETDRIRDFQLDGEVRISSHITEINELAQAMDAMKQSLRSFGAYVPKALVRNIVTAGASTKIGGERQFLTVMFSDVKDFTRNCEALRPEDVSINLSVYFEEMSAAIHNNNGIIDKFIGDAIMAVWNAPVPDPDHVLNACRSMLACYEVSHRIDQQAMPLYTRFGLHCGQMMVGNIGSEDRMQFTVLGAAVNLAARLEGLNKLYGTQMLVSDAVQQIAQTHFLFRRIDRVVPSGVSMPFDIYELVGELAPEARNSASVEDHARCRVWETCMDCYRAGDWDEAHARFQNFLDAYPDDGPAQAYVRRCAGLLAAPPPTDWDGAQHYDQK